jgi:hypothetical protein
MVEGSQLGGEPASVCVTPLQSLEHRRHRTVACYCLREVCEFQIESRKFRVDGLGARLATGVSLPQRLQGEFERPADDVWLQDLVSEKVPHGAIRRQHFCH